MDIQLEKEAIIKRFQRVTDESLIKTVKNLLDSAQESELLEASIDRGLAQSIDGQTKPHKEVMAGMRKKYKASTIRSNGLRNSNSLLTRISNTSQNLGIYLRSTIS